MTVPHRPERALAPVSVQAAATALRARGHRVSSARRLVLEALFAARGEPLSAEDVAAGATGMPGCDLASVYRNLDTLEQTGLVHHVHLGHGPGRYALSDPGAGGYAVCGSCDAHVVLPGPAVAPVAAAVRAACGFEPDFTHFPLTGRCPACTEEARDARP
jgi:Fur family transcriptional regulator, ferric uptake regulator